MAFTIGFSGPNTFRGFWETRPRESVFLKKFTLSQSTCRTILELNGVPGSSDQSCFHVVHETQNIVVVVMFLFCWGRQRNEIFLSICLPENLDVIFPTNSDWKINCWCSPLRKNEFKGGLSDTFHAKIVDKELALQEVGVYNYAVYVMWPKAIMPI